MLAPFFLSALIAAQAAPGQTLATPMQIAQLEAPSQQTLESGACLDAPRPVPRVLMKPVERSMQVVRIDRVVSTASMMPNETIGYLYTLADGSTWLGQRTQDYMSSAAATQMNQVLSITHQAGQNVSQFPPQTREGIPTKYTQFFRVQIAQTSLSTLRVVLLPCVAWPAGRPLPDPSM
jgi:hypothetical protein